MRELVKSGKISKNKLYICFSKTDKANIVEGLMKLYLLSGYIHSEIILGDYVYDYAIMNGSKGKKRWNRNERLKTKPYTSDKMEIFEFLPEIDKESLALLKAEVELLYRFTDYDKQTIYNEVAKAVKLGGDFMDVLSSDGSEAKEFLNKISNHKRLDRFEDKKVRTTICSEFCFDVLKLFLGKLKVDKKSEIMKEMSLLYKNSKENYVQPGELYKLVNTNKKWFRKVEV